MIAHGINVAQIRGGSTLFCVDERSYEHPLTYRVSEFRKLKTKEVDARLVGDCWHLGRIAGAISDSLRLGCVLWYCRGSRHESLTNHPGYGTLRLACGNDIAGCVNIRRL